MTAPFSEADVLDVLGWAAGLGVDAWLDGGWGVDALVGRQTRSHSDLDLVIEARHGHAFVERLREHGFDHVPMWYTTDAHTVWRDTAGVRSTFTSSSSTGTATGRMASKVATRLGGSPGGAPSVARLCAASPEIQVEFHRGYEIRPQDRHDVGLLCEKFAVPLPSEYRR